MLVPARELLTDPARLAALATVLPAALANRDGMDRLAELAATVMDAPVGLVNLIGDRHQDLVGLVGLGEPHASQRRLPVAVGYCPATTLAAGKPVYIEDAAEDPAFAEHSAHLDLGFVAYAGVPLRDADGQLLGTLCVTDNRAHRWRRADRRALEALAELVIGELALHRDVDRRQRLLDAFAVAPAAIAVTRGPHHVLEYHNTAYQAVFGDLALDTPARAAMPDLPGEFFTLMDQVLTTGRTYAATDAAVTLVWPGEQSPRERFFDFSYSPIGRATHPATTDAHRGLLVVAVEVTARVRAHRELARRARHQELLTRAGAALHRKLDPTEELRALAQVAVPDLADLSTVHLLTHPVPAGVDPPLPVITDRVAVAVGPAGTPAPEIRSGIAWHGDGDPITATIRRGQMLHQPIATPTTPPWAAGTGADAAYQGGLNHVVLAPVIVDGMVVAVVVFGMCGDRPLWEADELTTLAQIARHAGVAVGHALAYQHTRTSASVLQRSLLTDPPDVDGLQICARYRPAGRDEVGGDWYDAFERRPDQLALVVGDVMGHDITAAAAMAQLRAILRGLALDRDDGPAAALDRLDAINTRLRITPFATLVHAHLTRTPTAAGEPEWTLRWATAGHPPPLLLTPDSGPRLLDQPAGAALIRPPTTPRTESEITMPPGSTLLLYTDGLIETHDTDLDDNLADAATLVARHAHRPLGELCDELLHHAATTDDVAVLAVRIPHTTGRNRAAPTPLPCRCAPG